MEHPDDYKLTNDPIDVECIHHKKPHHDRLILRISVKVENEYIPLSFICDTGSPSYLFLCQKSIELLKPRIQESELEALYITSNNKNILIQESPINHKNSNIIGLKLLFEWGLSLNNGFQLLKIPKFI